MKIGILGSGGVAQALAKGFLKHGDEVCLGTHHPEKLAEFMETTQKKARVGSFLEAAHFGEMLVLAVKGTAALSVIQLLGEEPLKGKTIIDTTNPIADAPPDHGVLNFFTGLDDSLMERLQKAAPMAHFVKAFSCIGNALMVNPDFGDTRPTMFLCGNHSPSKNRVADLVQKFGFEPEDMGGAEAARAIEPLCILWCLPGFLKNDWTHALRWMKKP